MSLESIVDALSTATARSAHRMGVVHRGDDVLVVDDAYNASPESMAAALDAFRQLATGRRRWAVLGEMRELGDQSEEFHRDVGRVVAMTGVDELLVVSRTAEPIAAGAASDPTWSGRRRVVSDADEAVAVLRAELKAGDAVLVSGTVIAARMIWRTSKCSAGRPTCLSKSRAWRMPMMWSMVPS